jgi:hypothetical protein
MGASVNSAADIDSARSVDRAAGDDGAAARANATGAINSAGANDGVGLLDRGDHRSHENEGRKGGEQGKFHFYSLISGANSKALG